MSTEWLRGKLPWQERISMLSINPEAATLKDIADLAAEAMELNAKNARLLAVAGELIERVQVIALCEKDLEPLRRIVGSMAMNIRDRARIIPFESMVFLFSGGSRSRGIIRMDLEEAAMLYRYARTCVGIAVEIGRLHGGSAMLMAAAGARVWSIDVKRSPDLDQSLAKAPDDVRERISLIDAKSVEVVDRAPLHIDLLFVDGDHDLEAVRADLAAWCPRIMAGGFVVLHDVRGCGFHLETAVDELKQSGDWREVDSIASLVVLQRRT